MSQLTLADIRINGGTQSRASIDKQVVGDYADAILAGDTFPPLVVYHDGANYWLADGFHRYEAYARAKIDQVAADVRQGTQRDAILFSVSANAVHGLRRTNDDKRRAVLTLLNDKEWSKWSDREIARRCAVHHDLVGKLRPAVTGVSASERTYTTKHGTKAEMQTANIGKRSEPAEHKPVNGHATLAKPTASAESELPVTEAAPADPERRKLEKLTPDALIDEVLGLRADLKDAKSQAAKFKAERDALKVQVSQLSAADNTNVIRELQIQVKNAESARWREGEKTKDALKQVYALKKELKAMGAREIPL